MYLFCLLEYIQTMNLWNAAELAEAHWLTEDELEDVILHHMR